MIGDGPDASRWRPGARTGAGRVAIHFVGRRAGGYVRILGLAEIVVVPHRSGRGERRPGGDGRRAGRSSPPIPRTWPR